jgi:hypothetical protein
MVLAEHRRQIEADDAGKRGYRGRARSRAGAVQIHFQHVSEPLVVSDTKSLMALCTGS